jgi:hypothetical protein
VGDGVPREGLDRVLFATRNAFPFARHLAYDVQDNEQEDDTDNAEQNQTEIHCCLRLLINALLTSHTDIYIEAGSTADAGRPEGAIERRTGNFG